MKEKIIKIILKIVLLFALGIGGYMYIENMPFSDALYMTIITVTTTGLYAGQALSEPGKYLTIILIILGITIFIQSINVFASTILFEYYNNIIKKRRLLKMIDKL
ncbi:MAG TPA: ion channel, partial [bacterium]|nr:ion channel [bacterium]